MNTSNLHLTTVYSGPMWKVLLLEGLLQAEGIPVLVPDRMIKTIDPYITGANVFDLRLQVPAEHVAAALSIVAENAGEEREDPELDPAERELLAVERLGRRICYAILCIVTSPFALWYAKPYLSRAAALRTRPRGHGYVLTAILLAGPMCFGLILLLFW